jgi:hypothetical protein
VRVTREDLRRLVRSVLTEGADVDPDRTYRCFGGRVVQFGSPECLDDIRMRMDDAAETRDSCDCRTDKRAAYNGLLQMLRREMREAERAHRVLYPEEGE